MAPNPLKGLGDYSRFVAELLDQFDIKSSTLSVWSDSPYTGIAEGEILFGNGLRLRMREEVDFDAGIIVSYGYEVYRGEERLYWYDDFPHSFARLGKLAQHRQAVPRLRSRPALAPVTAQRQPA